ncbi:hypothetical protein [Clostridium neonatale]|uniref:Uncharacterized protein n=1 Tax=Clostridium neonatale TaxID=137838 RepID=A0AA86K0R0_9CLOT|nr:hypothetical protein CNEO_60072 [Clostridium neonatale]
MVNEYTTKNTTHCSIKVIDKTTKVSIRINQELYGKVKKYAKDNNIQLVDIFSEMMMDYLQKIYIKRINNDIINLLNIIIVR